MYDVIILAGGFGTRLKTVTGSLPKPLADIAGKPFIIYLLDRLVSFQCRKVYLSLHYKAEAIIHAVSQCDYPFDIEFIVEKGPLGTGGAIKYVCNSIDADNVVVINGDSYTDLDFDALYEYKIERECDVVLSTTEVESPDRYGIVEFKDERVLGFTEAKKSGSCFINTGCYCISTALFRHISCERFSFEHEVLSKIEGFDIRVFIYSGLFIDIGVPEDYYKACELLCVK
jgi:D-glycero-alpha-D-manno-heptose 1-phosphate guanylyltransferase